MERFILHSLKLQDHPIFKDLSLDFYDKNDKPNLPYTSLIIGANGTGKSNLLRVVILLFSELNHLKTSKSRIGRVAGKFEMVFSLGKDKYNFSNHNFSDEKEKSKTTITRNGIDISFKEILLPSNIIALSNTITDKFPVELSDYSDYQYLGVKTNSNTARTTTFVNRTIGLLYNTILEKDVHHRIGEALEFLGYEKKLLITYYPRYKHHFFKGNLTVELFEDFFNSFWKYTRRSQDSPPWSINKFKSLKKSSPEKIIELTALCNKITENLEYESSRTKYFDVDLWNSFLSVEEIRLLPLLHSLDIVSFPTIGFYKKENYFSLENSSSGEYHFISGFIGLLACLKENSLVIIDEPENSLHPNWQMKYINFLKNIFKEYIGTHFLIASHSHFMVSDLESQSSTIVALERENGLTNGKLIPANTYGWSAEEILVKIFKVSSSRNHYLTEKLEHIFYIISQDPNQASYNELKKEVKELKEIDFSGLNEEDPLKKIVDVIFEKVNV